MFPSRLAGAPRWSLAVVVAVLQAACVLVVTPSAHAVGGLGTVSISADVGASEPASPGSGARATFNVVLARTGPGTVTVDYQTVAGTATPGLDYGDASGTLVFSNTETKKSIAVSVLYDAFDEPDEAFTLQLTGAGNAALGSPAIRTGTIHDANANPKLWVSDTSVAENGGPARFVVTLSAPSANSVTVNAATADGTATVAGLDYTTLASTPVTFAPGELAKVVTVAVTDDSTTESSETFKLNLSAPSGASMADNQGVATIVDDDGPPVISIDDAPAVTEGASPATVNAAFTVNLSHASASAVTVKADTADGTATAPADYTAVSNQTITIPAGQTTATLNVPVKGDALSEATETFAVSLSAPSGGVLGDSDATGTITDDDAGVKVAVTGGGDVVEGDGVGASATFAVTLAQASGQTVTVDYATVDGTAIAVEDYVPPLLPHTLTFNPGTTTQTISVLIVGDVIPEDEETFGMVLSNVTGGAVLDVASASATILNDDGPPPRVTVSNLSVPELDSGATDAHVNVTLSSAPAHPVVVTWATADGTAKAGSDYTGTSGVLVFSGSGTQSVSVPVRGDTLDEYNETFSVVLTSVTNALGTGDSATVTIADDDATPTLAVSSVAVGEGRPGDVTQASVTVTLSAPSGRTVTVDHATSAGTATAGADFTTAAPGTLTFDPGQTSKTVTVEVLGDDVDENDETLSVGLSNASNAGIATGTGTVTITDDDAAPVVSVTDAPSVGEDDGTPATFAVTLSRPSAKGVDVTVATTSGTATAGSDFTAVPATVLHFVSGGPIGQVVNVPVLDDAVADSAPAEHFTLALTSPVNATLDPSADTGAGTILDDDGPATLSVEGATVAEGSTGETPTATFKISLVPAADAPVTVDWATGDGTATAGNDYSAASGTLTIPAGSTVAQVDVTVLGDTFDEIDEAFTFTLSHPTGAALDGGGSTLAATGTIDDDDLPVLWATAPPPVAEGSSGTSPARFVVKLSSPSPDPVTVDWTTSAGTATAGADYTTTSGTVTFAPGQTARAADVPVVGDTTDELDETFTLTLSNAAGAVLAGAPTATATIADDDGPSVSVAGPPTAVTEGDAGTVNATFTVTLSAASPQTVTVNYATAAGTATSGTDYTATSGTLTFTPGQTSKPVAVAVKGDTTNENNETFSLALSAPVAATLGTASASATIVDDDTPGSLTVNDVTVTEGTGTADARTATFTVRLSPARPKTVTVHYETVAGTASSPSDYTAASGTLAFAAGETTRLVSVAIVPDSRNEATERFFLHLSAPTGAALGDGDGTATITDDDSPGYLLVGGDGAVYPFGDTALGATGQLQLTRPVVGSTPTPSGNGYWMVASDGGVFAIGDARFFGSAGAITLNKPIVSMTATPTGNGYWLVASDGGVFSFGDAHFYGSTGAITLNKPIVSMTATPTGNGYWFVASDGGVFNFGDASYQGAAGSLVLGRPIVAIVAV